MPEVNTVLFYIVALDALAILLMGVVTAGLILAGKEAEKFFNQVLPATVTLILTSFGAGVVLWIGDYMFA